MVTLNERQRMDVAVPFLLSLKTMKTKTKSKSANPRLVSSGQKRLEPIAPISPWLVSFPHIKSAVKAGSGSAPSWAELLGER